MIYKRQIEEELKELNGLMNLVQIYGEIASIRMKNIRGSVLKNRDFLNSIHEIFKDVLAAYAAKLAGLVKKGKMKEGGKVTLLAHNGKTVAVFISANTGFYGEVVQNTFRVFVEEVRKSNVEVTIIGKLGLALFNDAEPNRPYTYFTLPDYGVDREALSEVIKHLVQYEEIWIYYGEYYSVVTQKPDKIVISAGTPVTSKPEAVNTFYIFEPSVEKILMFFETEIFASLFDQAVRESQLAKFASRMMAMDAASENIKTRISTVNLKKMQVVHGIMNRKQLNSIAPVMELGL